MTGCRVVWFIVSVLGTDSRRFKSCHPDKLNLEIMKEATILKINKRNLCTFKDWIGCYEISKNRIFEAVFCEKAVSLSLGIKYKVLLEREKIFYKKFFLLNIMQMETSFSCMFFKFKQKNYKNISFLLRILNQIYKKKFCIKGRILNDVKGGFAVGSIGLICFLPKSRAFDCKVGFVYSFSILSIDSYRNSFVLFQKRSLLKSRRWNKKTSKRIQIFKKLKVVEGVTIT